MLRAAIDLRSEAEEYRDIDGEQVLVLLYITGRGKVSGVDLGQMMGGANLFHVRDGKVTRLVPYWQRERALADLGLAQEGDSPSS